MDTNKETETKPCALQSVSSTFKPIDFKLCYIEDGLAYFTTQSLQDQWGDDWNDAPYDCNAGTPYTYDDRRKDKEPYEIVTVAFTTQLDTPSVDRSGIYRNSKYSVEMINNKEIPWLYDEFNEIQLKVWAGISLPDFLMLSKHPDFCGDVFIPVRWLEA